MFCLSFLHHPKTENETLLGSMKIRSQPDLGCGIVVLIIVLIKQNNFHSGVHEKDIPPFPCPAYHKMWHYKFRLCPSWRPAHLSFNIVTRCDKYHHKMWQMFWQNVTNIITKCDKYRLCPSWRPAHLSFNIVTRCQMWQILWKYVTNIVTRCDKYFDKMWQISSQNVTNLDYVQVGRRLISVSILWPRQVSPSQFMSKPS